MSYTLEESLDGLRAGLRVPKEKREEKWAGEKCVLSRYVHLNVWRYCPPSGKVKGTMIPLLKKAQRGVLTLIASGKFKTNQKKRMKIYSDNIGLRIKNLEENYLTGKLSNFVPDAKLDGKEAKAVLAYRD